MILNMMNVCLALAFISCVSSYYVIPLRAGTIQVSDSDLRQAKILRKMIQLNLTKSDYQAHKDTNVIASITSISMDQNLNFHFLYDIVCPNTDCLLNFTLVRYTQTMNPQFSYSFEADYLVARGLKVRDLNMTSFQNHMFLSQVVSYNQNNEKQDLSLHLPFNNEDAMYMLLFPTGFNNLTLTGHVVYSYILETDMYVVHYMDHTGQHGEHDNMGWPENMNYIQYRAVFIPTKYLEQNGCVPLEKFLLTQHFQYSCDGGSKVKWFVGFKSTKETHIQGEVFDRRAGFSYSLAETPSRYGLMAFPFQTNDDFIDLRTHEYKWDVEYRMIGHFSGYIIAASIIGAILLVFGLYLKKYLKKMNSPFKKVGKYDHMHQQGVVETPTS